MKLEVYHGISGYPMAKDKTNIRAHTDTILDFLAGVQMCMGRSLKWFGGSGVDAYDINVLGRWIESTCFINNPMPFPFSVCQCCMKFQSSHRCCDCSKKRKQSLIIINHYQVTNHYISTPTINHPDPERDSGGPMLSLDTPSAASTWHWCRLPMGVKE